MAAFELSFSIREEFLKKKISEEIVFAFISLKYKSLKAGQLPQGHFSFLQNLLSFIFNKIFETRSR